jgi:hypothetical protein
MCKNASEDVITSSAMKMEATWFPELKYSCSRLHHGITQEILPELVMYTKVNATIDMVW